MRAEYDFTKGTRGKYSKHVTVSGLLNSWRRYKTLPPKTWWWDTRLFRTYLLVGLMAGVLVVFFNLCWWLIGL